MREQQWRSPIVLRPSWMLISFTFWAKEKFSRKENSMSWKDSKATLTKIKKKSTWKAHPQPLKYLKNLVFLIWQKIKWYKLKKAPNRNPLLNWKNKRRIKKSKKSCLKNTKIQFSQDFSHTQVIQSAFSYSESWSRWSTGSSSQHSVYFCPKCSISWLNSLRTNRKPEETLILTP